MNSKLVMILVLLVLILGVGAYFVWRNGDDCSFSSKKRTLGIDLEAGLGDVNSVKGKIGITDDQVRDFDELSKDLALKYDMLCQDRKQKRDTHICLNLGFTSQNFRLSQVSLGVCYFWLSSFQMDAGSLLPSEQEVSRPQ